MITCRYLLPLLVAAAGMATDGHAGTNILTNASFEGGLTGWNDLNSTAMVVSYGSSDVASVQVGAVIGGGNRLLRAGGSLVVVEQVVDVGAVDPSLHAYVGGYLGGFSGQTDFGSIVIRFLDAQGAEIALRNLPEVTACSRELRDGLDASRRALCDSDRNGEYCGTCRVDGSVLWRLFSRRPMPSSWSFRVIR